MTIEARIFSAFVGRTKPQTLVELQSPITPEQSDALWFGGRDWQDVGWAEWEAHSDAFFAFVPEAFIYYLPSILLSQLRAPNNELRAADALIAVLDRSPNVENWDTFMVERLVGLRDEEYDVLADWLLTLSGDNGPHDEESLMRAYETVGLLKTETTRLRSTLDARPPR